MKTIVGIIIVLAAILTTTALFAVGEVTVIYKDGIEQTYEQIQTVIEYYNQKGELEQIRLIPFSPISPEIAIRYEEIRTYQVDRFRVDVKRCRINEEEQSDNSCVHGGETADYDESSQYGHHHGHHRRNNYENFVKMTFAPVFFNDGNGYFRNDRYVYIRTPASFYIDRGWFIDNSTGTIFLGDQNGRGWIYQIVSEVNFGGDNSSYDKEERIKKINRGW